MASAGLAAAQSPSAGQPTPVEPSFAPTPAPVGTLGTPEGQRHGGLSAAVAELRRAPPVAQDRGFWQECGLTDVQLIQTEQVMPGVVGTSLDFGIVETVDTGQAQLDGLPIKVIAGYRPYSMNVIGCGPRSRPPLTSRARTSCSAARPARATSTSGSSCSRRTAMT
ncbi:MAG: hypothetical protein R3C32_01225 [Chloroflexota bacterium]